MRDKTAVIESVCAALVSTNPQAAAAILRDEYPFISREPAERRYDETTCTRIFVRDGFVDRYSGARLVFPGTMRLISKLLPNNFPFHPNWKMSATHPAYWELFPTLDHILPVARGGLDHESNWVTTSQLRNSAKGAWTLDELGWQLHPPGDYRRWDGLVSWFVAAVRADSSLQADGYSRAWYRAAETALRI